MSLSLCTKSVSLASPSQGACIQPVAIFNSSPYVTEMLNYFLSWLCPSYITQTLFDIIIPLMFFGSDFLWLASFWSTRYLCGSTSTFWKAIDSMVWYHWVVVILNVLLADPTVKHVYGMKAKNISIVRKVLPFIYNNISATVQARESRQIADIRELQAIICLPFTAFEPDLLHN